MCRWLAYIGKPITPRKYLYDDEFSLVEQSLSARQSKSVVNGDGFGLGWYGDLEEPGLFRDVLPAWNDENLKDLSCQIKSGLFMAHVRAATDTPSNRSNCHPFRYKNSLFMHNGQIGGYLTLRRDLEKLIPDDQFRHRLGSTDSEAILLLLETYMQQKSFEEATTILIDTINQLIEKHNIDEPFRFTACYTDGISLKAVKYSSDKLLPTLFYRQTGDGWLLVSEPLDDEHKEWIAVPDNHYLEISRDSQKPDICRL